MLYYLIVLVVIILIGSNKKWDLKKKILLIISFLVLCAILFFIAIIWGFDRGREPLNVEEFSYEKVDSLDKEEEVIDIGDNVEELTVEEDSNVSEGVMSMNINIGSKIYGDGKKEYAYRKLVKERSHFY